MNRITKIAAASALAVALVGTAGAANAATINDAGAGFVGKGEVQSAFGWNNKDMQGATATGFTFSTTQSATKALTQDASQVVTQDAHADVTRTVSCFIDGKKVDHTAFGTRDGSRTGVRNGERTGTLHGSLKGSLTSTVAYDTKGKTGQWTGFYLTKYAAGSPAFSTTESPVWNIEAQYGDAEYGDAVAELGEVNWTGWQSEPGQSPADCLRGDTGNEIVTDLQDVTVESEIEYGTEHFGAEDFTNTQDGAITPEGAVSLFVTYGSSTKPLTITVPVIL
jgi:hypothetical protein